MQTITESAEEGISIRNIGTDLVGALLLLKHDGVAEVTSKTRYLNVSFSVFRCIATLQNKLIVDLKGKVATTLGHKCCIHGIGKDSVQIRRASKRPLHFSCARAAGKTIGVLLVRFHALLKIDMAMEVAAGDIIVS